MKRKRTRQEERRRPVAETNLLDDPKRIDVRRRGCGPFFGSTLLFGGTVVGLIAGLR
jgi:hypothetical protein